MRLSFLNASGLALLGAVLGGCAGGANYHVQSGPLPHQALADEVYLDGTGPSARGMSTAPAGTVEHRRAEVPATGVTRPVVRTRPTALPREGAEDLSASSTTGARSSSRDEANKPFSEQWLQRERQEDARLKSKMNICRGC